MTTDILVEKAKCILHVKINRPSKKNALTSAMYETLAEVFHAAAQNDAVNVVLWSGTGDSFCAGNDLEDFLENPPGPGSSPQAALMAARRVR